MVIVRFKMGIYHGTETLSALLTLVEGNLVLKNNLVDLGCHDAHVAAL